MPGQRCSNDDQVTELGSASRLLEGGTQDRSAEFQLVRTGIASASADRRRKADRAAGFSDEVYWALVRFVVAWANMYYTVKDCQYWSKFAVTSVSCVIWSVHCGCDSPPLHAPPHPVKINKGAGLGEPVTLGEAVRVILA
jgi:hypothetical protein